MFLNPNYFSNLNLNCSNLLDLRNVQECVKIFTLLPKLFWCTVRKNCRSDREKLLKFETECWEFANFSKSIEQLIFSPLFIFFSLLFLPHSEFFLKTDKISVEFYIELAKEKRVKILDSDRKLLKNYICSLFTIYEQIKKSVMFKIILGN